MLTSFSYPLPKKCIKLIGKNDVGPNCWNAVMYALGATNKLEFIDKYKMSVWMEENTEIIDTPPQPGDILRLNEYSGEIGHTALFLGDDKYFHKVGWNSSVGWEVVSLARVLEHYHYLNPVPVWYQYVADKQKQEVAS